MNNSVIDLVIRIKNGYIAKKETVFSPYSAMREEVLKKLVALGFLKAYSIGKEPRKHLVMELLYHDAEIPAFTDVKIYSRPGRRWYVQAKELRPVLGRLGAMILSTPKGVMTNTEAKKENIGGELLFEVW